MHTTVLALFDNLFDMIPENERCGNQCVCIRELGEIHVSAKEGEIEDLKKHMETCLHNLVSDSRKRTPLHLAVDHGHLGAVELLVSSNADVNAQDNQGQTPLHYAVRCEKEDIAQLLVKHHADLQIKDGDGNTAPDLCSSAWPFLKPAN
ncbi:acyl-CoA-binding domain-containing protein 4 [Triticum aestivum]|uniref:acyl-CoA-binding domain-containing protein 4 n=1 Tax=Triticum aestivum TaxID=4565 RepID=UPI001D0313F9|nr:acyl-CoA-binding domain-containing protein 4-like [Triticum aestivum]